MLARWSESDSRLPDSAEAWPYRTRAVPSGNWPLAITGVFHLASPLDMGAIGAQPVVVLLVVLSPAVRLYLQLLSR